MKIPSVLAALMLGCAFTANAEEPDGANAMARVQLAAANVPGDLLSDAYLVEMLDVQLQVNASGDSLDPALREEMMTTRDRLRQRVEVGLQDEPALLATLGNCLGRYKDGSDCADRMQRMAEAAHANGYYHFVLANVAADEGDAEGFSREVGKMRESKVFTPVFLAVFSSLYERYRRVPDALWRQGEDPYGPVAGAGVLAMAQAAAVALPAYSKLLRFCDAAEGETRKDCYAVGKQLARTSPVLLEQGIGLALLEKLGDESDLAMVRERRREVRWLQGALGGFDEQLDDSQMGQYFDIFAREGEFAAIRYAATAMGRSLQPPVDWQP